MSYTIFDIEITEPLCDLHAAGDDEGVAILLRRKGVPIAFWMEELGSRPAFRSDALADEIARRAGEEILAEAIREELGRPFVPPPLPLLSVAICTRDGGERVARLLDSLGETLPTVAEPNGSLDIIVVDNAPSDDRTRTLVDERGGARYVLEPRPGLNFARNRAIAEARGALLAFLDDDVVVDQHWRRGLAEAVGENPDAVAFTGLVLPLELTTRAQVLFEQRGGFRRGFEKIRYGARLPGNPLYPAGAGIFGAGANMAFRTDVLRELGGFDEALDTGGPVPGGGDLDIFYRIIRAGRPIAYEPRFLAFHEHRRELAELRRQYRRSWGLGFMVFVTKCLRADPERRLQLLAFIAWWFRWELSELGRSIAGSQPIRGSHPIPPAMILGELYGGIVGLLGGYGRSRRRVARIRRTLP